jgi:hypothetical protein
VDTLDLTLTGSPRVTVCRYGCDGARFESVCEKSSDCPPVLETGIHGGARRQSCRPLAPAPTTPKWIGACRP